MEGYIELSAVDLLIASCLVLFAGGVSVWLRLGLERSLALAALRCVVQLGLIGLILRWIFSFGSPWPVVAWLAVMLFFASSEVIRRSDSRMPGLRFDALLTMTVAALSAGGVVTQLVIGPDPWYDPRFIIPIFGMLFGNSLNGICLGLDRFNEWLQSRRDEVELLLAFGATRGETVRPALRQAVRTGMIPIMNNMSVAGLVSLPGMMTGQILAGVSPVQAVGYQIVIMFMIAASNAIGTMTIVLLAGRKAIGPHGVAKW